MSVVSTIVYQDKSKRIIRHTKAFNNVLKGEPSVQQKIRDVAYSTGLPYHIHAVDGVKDILNVKDFRNKPN